MTVNETGFEGLLEIFPAIYNDERGWFYESYNKNTYQEKGITTEFVQENQSFSKKGVVRGLHFQLKPFAQAKLVTVITGKIVDVVVVAACSAVTVIDACIILNYKHLVDRRISGSPGPLY